MTVDLLRIKAERTANNLTQDELAKKLGWTRSQYAKREAGFVSFSANELIAVAEVLGYNKDNIGIFFKNTVPETQH